jgi:hypothetical protein
MEPFVAAFAKPTWVIVVTLLYRPYRWFADLKQRRRDAWLSYF